MMTRVACCACVSLHITAMPLHMCLRQSNVCGTQSLGNVQVRDTALSPAHDPATARARAGIWRRSLRSRTCSARPAAGRRPCCRVHLRRSRSRRWRCSRSCCARWASTCGCASHMRGKSFTHGVLCFHARVGHRHPGAKRCCGPGATPGAGGAEKTRHRRQGRSALPCAAGSRAAFAGRPAAGRRRACTMIFARPDMRDAYLCERCWAMPIPLSAITLPHPT